MNVLWTIRIGFIVGMLAKFLTPGRDPSGFFITVAIGMAGSFVATFLGRAMHWSAQGQAAGFMGSLIGAILLLAVWHIVRPKSI
ncbi:MAG: GlsB/YeaQ/YmgE family stress response membrane protein [Chthoniobacteraceae bacterium]